MDQQSLTIRGSRLQSVCWIVFGLFLASLGVAVSSGIMRPLSGSPPGPLDRVAGIIASVVCLLVVRKVADFVGTTIHFRRGLITVVTWFGFKREIASCDDLVLDQQIGIRFIPGIECEIRNTVEPSIYRVRVGGQVFYANFKRMDVSAALDRIQRICTNGSPGV